MGLADDQVLAKHRTSSQVGAAPQPYTPASETTFTWNMIEQRDRTNNQNRSRPFAFQIGVASGRVR